MRNILYLLIIAVLTLTACESMEDTYSKYDTPKERYVGKCDSLKVETGWERIRLTWKNSVDASISNIVLIREDDLGNVDTLILPPDTEMYYAENLDDRTYRFFIYAVDSIRDLKSLPISTYVKAFNDNTDVVKALKIVERKSYFLNNSDGTERLILLFSSGTRYIEDCTVHYISNGEAQETLITDADFDKGIKKISKLDAGTEVAISSKMKLEECIDTIVFAPYALDRSLRNFNADFLVALMDQLQTDDVTPYLDTLSVLHINYNIRSLEDIMYLPNLDTLVLAKRRRCYNQADFSALYDNFGTTYPEKFSHVDELFLDVSAYAINEKRSSQNVAKMNVDIYRPHFNKLASKFYGERILDAIEEEEIPVQPTDYLNWKISFNDSTYYDNESPGNNYTTQYPIEGPIFGRMWTSGSRPKLLPFSWKSKEIPGKIATHEFICDMNYERSITGFRFDQIRESAQAVFAPRGIDIFLSKDGQNWVSALVQPTFRVGNLPEEITVFNYPQPKRARYFKLVVSDVVTNSNNAVAFYNFTPLF